MKAITMCFSLLQFPRCRVHSLANFRWEGFHHLVKKSGGRSSYRVLCATNYDPEGGYSRRLIKRSINSKAKVKNEILTSNTSIRSKTVSESKLGTTKVQRSKKVSIGNEIDSESTHTGIDTYRAETTEVELDPHDKAKLATVICFDIETTGFSRDKDRIIEFACQDLRGGENSTLQTLVNPERKVLNEHIHGISTCMVNSDDVPRMKDFIPILLQYVSSRQLPDGDVILVSHNGRTFDVPFLKSEFSRCFYEIPKDWLFADTLSLAREVMKSKGPEAPSKLSLQALREYYRVPLIGPAHRALSDVHTLALVLQRLTYDLKMPVSGLIQRSFKSADVIVKS